MIGRLLGRIAETTVVHLTAGAATKVVDLAVAKIPEARAKATSLYQTYRPGTSTPDQIEDAEEVSLGTASALEDLKKKKL